MTNKPKDSIQAKNDDPVKLLFLQTLDFSNVFHSLKNNASLLIRDSVEMVVVIKISKSIIKISMYGFITISKFRQ